VLGLAVSFFLALGYKISALPFVYHGLANAQAGRVTLAEEVLDRLIAKYKAMIEKTGA
jgi:predicted transcriptional regulator